MVGFIHMSGAPAGSATSEVVVKEEPHEARSGDDRRPVVRPGTLALRPAAGSIERWLDLSA